VQLRSPTMVCKDLWVFWGCFPGFEMGPGDTRHQEPGGNQVTVLDKSLSALHPQTAPIVEAHIHSLLLRTRDVEGSLNMLYPLTHSPTHPPTHPPCQLTPSDCLMWSHPWPQVPQGPT